MQDPQSAGVLVAILVGVLTAVLLFFLARRRLLARGRAVALLGVREAGKTAAFAKLLHGKGVETYTSVKENAGRDDALNPPHPPTPPNVAFFYSRAFQNSFVFPR